MAPTFYEKREEYTHSCYQGTLGSCDCKRLTTGNTMPSWGAGMYEYNKNEPLTEQQRQRLWLIERRNQEMKRAWKKDQLYNSRQQIRI